MEANELMIGDWVHLKDCDGAYDIITGITDRGVLLDANSDGSFEDIEPIPLTPEILEKNGFICKGAWMISGEDLGLRQCGDYFKLLPYYYDYDATGMCDIYYVHELQHALRLCGLTEIADNFKV